MAPLRFRAWDKKEKILSRVCGFHFDESDEAANMIHVDLFPECPSWFQSDCEVMQSTGLFDKNEPCIEVFEGDIIDTYGKIKGNIYEMDKGETDLVIEGVGTEDWLTTHQEAMARGLSYPKQHAN